MTYKMITVNYVLGMAVAEGTMPVEKAVAMTQEEKLDWYEHLLDDENEEELL